VSVEVYSKGLVHCSVCVPKTLGDEAIAETVNKMNPTGIDSRWKVSADTTFADGSPNPNQCEHLPGNKHVLMVC